MGSKSAKDEKSKSVFSCCGCGDKETHKEAYVDIKDKVPDRALVIEDHYKLRTIPPAPIIQRPSSMPKVRNTTTLVKPKVLFTYTSPNQ